jgi:glycosyltransferase involved in cell wall biosynthesis
MRHRDLRRILVLATGPLNERLAGPEIRALEFAKALSAEYEVTLLAQRREPCERDGIRVIPSSRRRVLAEAARHDAVLSASVPPYLLALKSVLGIAAIADQYDPHELELVTDEKHDRELQTWAMSKALQLRHADLVLCASTRQRDELIAAAGRYKETANPRPALDPAVVPFGIPDPPEVSPRRPLQARFPQIADSDTVVIWWGTAWRWLDADTVIRAFARIASTRPDVKLVITGGTPPKRNDQRFNATGDAIALARELGVLDRTVLFLDDWIPYHERYDYLREATIGVTLHRSSAEAALAARARYMDYLSAELPCVLGRGDETAADFEAAGFATLLDRPDPDLLASTLLALVNDPTRLARSREAGHRLAAERQWSAVGRTLRAAVASMPRPSPVGLVGETGTYYGRRVADRLVAAAQ